jgi:hypothetical protein
MASAESLLRDLLGLHDLGKKNLTNDYEAVRKIRREQDSKWEEARVLLNGEPAIDNKPRTAGEAERWNKRAAAVAQSRKKSA